MTIGDVTITVSRGGGANLIPPAAPAAVPDQPAPAPALSEPSLSEPEAMVAPVPVNGGVPVRSPVLGVFWRASAPGAAPFVGVGSDRGGGRHAVHRRGDEADEPRHRRRRRHGRGDARDERRTSSSSGTPLFTSTRRDRAGREPSRRVLVANRGEIAVRIVRACFDAGHRDRRRRLRGRPRRLAAPARRPTRSCIGPGARAARATSAVEPDRRRRDGDRAATPSIPATASSPSAPSSPRPAPAHGHRLRRPAAPTRCAAPATRSRARDSPQRPAIPIGAGSDGVEDADEAAARRGRARLPGACSRRRPAEAGGAWRRRRPRRELDARFARLAPEAQQAFGDGRLYLERFVERARHVEVQMLADRHGNVVHLGERDCSLPAPLPEARRGGAGARTRPTGSARHLRPPRRRSPRALDYDSAGTVEFLVDTERETSSSSRSTPASRSSTRSPRWSPASTSSREQLRIAAGEPLSFAQDDVAHPRPRHRVPHQRRGPRRGLPPVARPLAPLGRRRRDPASASTPTASRATLVPPYYDSLLAKVIVHGAGPGRRRRPHAPRARSLSRGGGRDDRRVSSGAALAIPTSAHGRSPPAGSRSGLRCERDRRQRRGMTHDRVRRPDPAGRPSEPLGACACARQAPSRCSTTSTGPGSRSIDVRELALRRPGAAFQRGPVGRARPAGRGPTRAAGCAPGRGANSTVGSGSAGLPMDLGSSACARTGSAASGSTTACSTCRQGAPWQGGPRGGRRGGAVHHVRHQRVHTDEFFAERVREMASWASPTRSTSRMPPVCSRPNVRARCCRRCSRPQATSRSRSTATHHGPGAACLHRGHPRRHRGHPHREPSAGQRPLAPLDRVDGRDPRRRSAARTTSTSTGCRPVAEHFYAPGRGARLPVGIPAEYSPAPVPATSSPAA